MKKIICLFICLVASSCGSKGTDVASISNESLIATAGPIPIAIEHKLTREDIKRLKQDYPKTLQRIRDYKPLHMQDVINMTRAGVTDESILHELRVTRSSFFLTPANERTLEQAGVSKHIINEMMDMAVDRY